MTQAVISFVQMLMNVRFKASVVREVNVETQTEISSATVRLGIMWRVELFRFTPTETTPLAKVTSISVCLPVSFWLKQKASRKQLTLSCVLCSQLLTVAVHPQSSMRFSSQSLTLVTGVWSTMAVRGASCGKEGTIHPFAQQRGSGEAQLLFVRVKSCSRFYCTYMGYVLIFSYFWNGHSYI